MTRDDGPSDDEAIGFLIGIAIALLIGGLSAIKLWIL